MLRCLALCLTFATLATAQTSYWSAALDPSQEVPPTPGSARGWGVVRLVEPANTVNIFVHEEGLVAMTAAHLHVAAVGVNGPIIVPLAASGPNDWTGSGVLTAANVTALKTAGTYLNVHTAAFPGGEIRGQVVAAASSRFTAVLNGAQETPPVPTAAFGTGVGFLHEPDNRFVYTVNTNGLGNVTAAHIHVAATGVPGPILHPLTGMPGMYCGVTPPLTAADVTTLKASGMYFNVHTAAFPAGEIRGQIIATVDDFAGAMNAAQEVPPNTSAAIGKAWIQIRPNGTVEYRVTVNGLSGPPTAAHIHVGAVGIAGPIVFAITGGPSVWTGTSPTMTPTQMNDCRSGNWYANVHTALNPAGEVRGQLRPLLLPTTYGGGCPGSNGTRPEIAADSAPCAGAGFRIDCHGALPATAAVINISFSRDANGAVNLPASLTLVGPAPNCYVLAAIGSTVFSLTDPMGCGHYQMNIPFNPAFTGTRLYSQWFVFDAAANPFGIITSNGLDMLVQ